MDAVLIMLQMPLQLTKQWHFGITTSTSHETVSQTVRQFLKLGTLLHFGTLSQICPTDPWPSRIQQGWVTYQGKPKLPPGQLPEVQSTTIFIWESKIVLNIDPELNRIIMLHVHRVNKAESVSAWSFSARETPEEVDLCLCLGSLGSEKGYLLGGCKGWIWGQKI